MSKYKLSISDAVSGPMVRVEVFYGRGSISHYTEKEIRICVSKEVEGMEYVIPGLWKEALNKLLMYKALIKRVE